MMTVRYIDPNGYEFIKESTGVVKTPGTWMSEGGSGQTTKQFEVGMFVEVRSPNGDVDRISDGDLYVMNETGKTVADYHWGGQPPKSKNNVG